MTLMNLAFRNSLERRVHLVWSIALKWFFLIGLWIVLVVEKAWVVIFVVGWLRENVNFFFPSHYSAWFSNYWRIVFYFAVVVFLRWWQGQVLLLSLVLLFLNFLVFDGRRDSWLLISRRATPWFLDLVHGSLRLFNGRARRRGIKVHWWFLFWRLLPSFMFGWFIWVGLFFFHGWFFFDWLLTFGGLLLPSHFGCVSPWLRLAGLLYFDSSSYVFGLLSGPALQVLFVFFYKVYYLLPLFFLHLDYLDFFLFFYFRRRGGRYRRLWLVNLRGLGRLFFRWRFNSGDCFGLYRRGYFCWLRRGRPRTFYYFFNRRLVVIEISKAGLHLLFRSILKNRLKRGEGEPLVFWINRFFEWIVQFRRPSHVHWVFIPASRGDLWAF